VKLNDKNENIQNLINMLLILIFKTTFALKFIKA
tara:strand:+ start:672 stop:773 length:102 start_codon:yes stop_codon:yes gene_type:complete